MVDMALMLQEDEDEDEGKEDEGWRVCLYRALDEFNAVHELVMRFSANAF